ncbi:MAG: insulinase family protein [Bacteroidetes bacterium]|nr:insulinase family protein [Bacteroidota bacterium]
MRKYSAAVKIKTDIPSVEFREFTLDNGLKIILSRTRDIPMVAVNTTFHVGSKDEDDDKTGMAHLLEHLMFEDSPNIPHGKFDEILNKNGGDSNAYTSWDSTGYYIALPSNKLETAFWLDSDRLTGFGITDESLRIQKDVIFEEKLLYVDNSPYGTVEEESSKRLFTECGYRNPVIGNMDHLMNVTLSDVRNFYEKYYSPDNAVISVVGDIDYNRTLKLIDKYYGGLIPGISLRKEFKNDNYPDSEIRAELKDNVHLAGKFIFYRLPEMGTKDYYSMSIINGILSDGESSRLFKELEYNNELVNEYDSNLYGMEKASIFAVSALVLKGKDPDTVEEKIDNVLEDIKNGNIAENEILKIKNRIETYFSAKKQSIISLSEKFSYLKTFYNNTDKINFEVLDYLSVSKNDIIETAGKYLDRNKRVVLNYKPN